MRIDNLVRYSATIFTAMVLGAHCSHTIASSCAEFEKEAEAFSGVIPRLDENGKVRAFLMYGESSFIAPKRSLIANARREAELDARRSFAEFLKSDFDAETVTSKLMESEQLTDQDGATSGIAKELKSNFQSMSQNANAVLSGIVKLDECVDVDGKYLLVQLGWKPSLSVSAADTVKAINSSSSEPDASDSKEAREPSNISPGTEVISLSVEGRGETLKSATNEALRSAVSQVFGEKFASQSTVSESVQSASISGENFSQGIAVEKSASTNTVQGQTSGLIRSWSYVEKKDEKTGFKVVLSVEVAKYKSSMDPNKTSIIVIKPVAGSDSIVQDQAYKEFATKIHGYLVESLGKTVGLNVLDRQHLDLAKSETALISKSGNMDELAKLGNQAGGDIMLVPVIDKFSYKVDVREIGNQTIERTIYDVILSTKVIEVATSNIVDAKNFPFRNKKIRSDEPNLAMALLLAKRASKYLARSIGGGYVSGYTDGYNAASEKKQDIKKIKDSIQESFEKARDNVKDDW